jgi:membrane protein YqaA with SNARE-associated domain
MVQMKRSAVVSILFVSTTAVLSAAILWLLMVDPSSLGRLGLLGIFMSSMLSHLTVVGRDMFVPMYLPLTSLYHPLALGAAAGIGAALGEVTTYFLGWGIAESLKKNSSHVESRLAGWIRRYGLWAVLLVAATPLPDTPIVLIAGSSRLHLGKLFLAECIGKTALYSIGAVVGGAVFTGLSDLLGGLAASLIIVSASILFCVLVAWERGRALLFGWFRHLLL